jgi:hypothetical protein
MDVSCNMIGKSEIIHVRFEVFTAVKTLIMVINQNLSSEKELFFTH